MKIGLTLLHLKNYITPHYLSVSRYDIIINLFARTEISKDVVASKWIRIVFAEVLLQHNYYLAWICIIVYVVQISSNLICYEKKFERKQEIFDDIISCLHISWFNQLKFVLYDMCKNDLLSVIKIWLNNHNELRIYRA